MSSHANTHAETGLMNLASRLSIAIDAAQMKIAALPLDLTIEDETAAIDAASADANNLAEWIVDLPAYSAEACEAKLRAFAWLDGALAPDVATNTDVARLTATVN